MMDMPSRERTPMPQPPRRPSAASTADRRGTDDRRGQARPRGVTSDPDRGVPPNSGTDPQRPGQPARRGPEPPGAADTLSSGGARDSTHRPASAQPEDVE